MLNWIDHILPSCCSQRTIKNAENVHKPACSYDFAAEIKIFPENEAKAEPDAQEDKACEETSSQVSQSFFPPEENHEFNESHSVSIAFSEIGENIEILCAECFKEANGFCPLCPNRRYCQKCYLKEHNNKIGHSFISYGIKKILGTRLDSIDKLVSLLKPSQKK